MSSGVRDRIWFGKTKFKGSGITVSEFLTKQRHQAFMAARHKFGVQKCWTKDGVIHIINSKGVRHRITKSSELDKIESQAEEKSSTSAKPTSKPKRVATQKK